MEGPLVLFLGSKVAANTAFFLVELRALALAVLAVQVCCRGLLCAEIAGSAGIVSKRSKSYETISYCCKTAYRKRAARL